MKCAVCIIIFIFFSAYSYSQIRLPKLEIGRKETYTIKDYDIVVVDSLIMRDSSFLVLNKLKPENFIHAKVAVFFQGSRIDGKGVHGVQGRHGRGGISPLSPCTDGSPGLIGTEGTNGGPGTNLLLYFSDIVLKGNLLIDVSGGDAGDGGIGGAGGGGGPGTRLCTGGNGGPGGLGARGGNGGNAGAVTFNSSRIPELRSMLGGRIVIRNYGGNQGLGGIGGAGGQSGLSPVGNSKLDGKTGRKGSKGKDGVPGKAGAINFQDK